jgi:hypothetical protein
MTELTTMYELSDAELDAVCGAGPGRDRQIVRAIEQEGLVNVAAVVQVSRVIRDIDVEIGDVAIAVLGQASN